MTSLQQPVLLLLICSVIVLAGSLCPDNCQVCTQDSQYCYSCTDGFINNFFGQCIPIEVPNCLILDNNNLCYTCAPTFSVKTGQCFKNYEGCLNQGPNGYCYQCGFGLNNQNKKCVGVINCQIYGQNLQCEKCMQGYQLQNNICIDISLQCQTIRQQDGLCQKCRDGNFISGYKCFPQQIYNRRCLIYANQTLCALCRNGFLLYDGLCLSKNQISRREQQKQILSEYCQVYDITSYICIRCLYGYYLQNNLCNQVSPLCESYNIQNGECLSCRYGTQFRNGECIDLNCVKNQQKRCIECKSGFQLGQSLLCQFIDENCINRIGNRCQQCASQNYFINQAGVCEMKPQGCFIVNYINSQCLQCLQSYQLRLSDRVCLKKMNIPNCLFQDPMNYGRCLMCQDRYYYSQNKCLRVSKLCGNYDSNLGTCITCKNTNFNLIDDKCIDPNCLAQVQDNCVQCKDQFRINQNSLACQYIGLNCQSIRQNKDGCQMCKTGYYLNDRLFCSLLPINCEKASENGTCLICQNGFRNTVNGCLQINIPNCVSYQPNSQFCYVCQNGYQITISGQCKQRNQNIPNCVQYNQGTCIRCSNRFILDSLARCYQVDNLCKTYNNQTGKCTSCYIGYQLSNMGACLLMNQSIKLQTQDNNCINFTDNICIQCANRFYVGNDGYCIPINPLCKDYNYRGQCTSCYPGYEISNMSCKLAINEDKNCRIYNNNQNCIQCYPGFFVVNGICQKVNPLCKTSNPQNGHCLSCYQGYTLDRNLKSCVILYKDPYCRTFDDQNNCQECSENFYLSLQNKCIPVSPYCKTYNSSTGQCLTCYSGYQLNGGQCELASNIFSYCKFRSNNLCIQCYDGYYPVDGKCFKLNRLCKTYNQINGACTSCYPGYTISGNDCIVDYGQTDNFCKQSVGQVCIQCYQGYIPIRGVCQIQNTNCKQIDLTNNLCKSCWQGYILNSGNCSINIARNQLQNDVYCLKFINNQCIQCSQGFYVNQQTKICQQLDNTCSSHNLITGECLACYNGYILIGKQCIRIQQLNVPNCLTINPQSGVCQTCLSSFYLSTDKKCLPVSITCRSYNKNNGKCLTCIPGHYLQDGKCILAAIYDDNCMSYDSGYCQVCKDGFYLSQYRCKIIDENCIIFDTVKTVCQECRNNYKPSGASCI